MVAMSNVCRSRRGFHTKSWTAAVCAFVALAAACGGGSSTKATSVSPPSTIRGARSTGATNTSSTTSSSSPSAVAKSAASAAELASLAQSLNAAGIALTESDGAIGGADVNQAKNQEGSAP